MNRPNPDNRFFGKRPSGILGNDSLRKLNAVIYTAKNYMLVNNILKIGIKQQPLQSANVDSINIAHCYLAYISDHVLISHFDSPPLFAAC